MKENKNVLKLVKAVKLYDLKSGRKTFVESLLSSKKKKTLKKFALNNVNLVITKGERVGIIGSNGSGKTTILKVLSGVTTLTSGRVESYGKVVSLIDLSAGFHPELSGKENILLNGLLVGMEYEEVIEKYEKIIKFTDIGEYINEPLFSYSDGMKLRLGFSIAICAEPDILLLDEGIAVGDIGFQKKCQKMILEFISQGKTIIFATHWLPILEEHCKRIIWIENGKIIMDGKIKNVLKEYISYNEKNLK